MMLGTASVSAQQPSDVSIVVNGQTMQSDLPPVTYKGSLMVPLRPMFKSLGASVEFKNGVIHAQRGAQKIALTPKVKTAKVNGKSVELSTPPMTYNGSTYVPLKFVAKALGDEVAFDKKTSTVSITGNMADPITVPQDEISKIKTNLKRLVIGNQGAILKIWNESGDEVAYYRGLDDRMTAPYDAKDQTELLSKLGYSANVEQVTADVINAYDLLPKRNVIAFLGLMNSVPEGSALDTSNELDQKIQEFLISRMKEEKSVVLRRQACLSLAVGAPLTDEVLDSVLELYGTSENLWETFPVQQFFEYQADKIRTRPDFSSVRARAAAVNSLYTPAILRYLDGEKE